MFRHKEHSPEEFLRGNLLPRIERFIKTLPSDLAKAVVREEITHPSMRNHLLSTCGAVIIEGEVLNHMYTELKPRNVGDFNVARFYTRPIIILVTAEATRKGSSPDLSGTNPDPVAQAIRMAEGYVVFSRLASMLKKDTSGFSVLDYLMGERSFLRRSAFYEFRLMELGAERYKTLYRETFGEPKIQS